jgi:hypothetical protein
MLDVTALAGMLLLGVIISVKIFRWEYGWLADYIDRIEPVHEHGEESAETRQKGVGLNKTKSDLQEEWIG